MSVESEGCRALRGERIALAGRLASLTRIEAERLIEARGGALCRTVSRRTTLVVVGDGGWPLRRDGRLSRNLRRATMLARAGHPIAILREDQFLERVGLSESATAVVRRYTLGQLAQLLHVSTQRLRGWVRVGLIRPITTTDGLAWFDYRQAAGAKLLCELARSGVSTVRLRRSLERLKQWHPQLDEPLAQLAVLEHTGGRLAVRVEDGRMLEPGGQRLLDFAEIERGAVTCRHQPSDPADLFEAAIACEDAGDLEAAAALYDRLLQLDRRDADVWFNRGNVLAALGRETEACAHHRQAVALDAGHAPAWNNLGNLLADAGDLDDAIRAFEQSLRADPGYDDARYNLARTLDDAGRESEAAAHWRAWLRAVPDGPEVEYARLRLSGAAMPVR